MISQSKKNIDKYKLAEAISVVSHQLKTPLSAIKGYLEVLMAEEIGELNQEQKEYLADALENIRRMIGLVRDLLDVSRIEEGKMEFKPRPANVVKIVKETIKEFSPLAKAKNCSISFKIEEEIPLLIIDPLKIKQVVSNLISNAIEYNKRKGKIVITLKKQRNKVLFCCQDSGMGIPDSEKKKIFKKFYRSEKAITMTTAGSGLGLFISKAIIEKSGGKIWFESEEGRGSVFCFSLPIKNY